MWQLVSEVADRRDADDRRGAAQYDVWWNFIIYMGLLSVRPKFVNFSIPPNMFFSIRPYSIRS